MAKTQRPSPNIGVWEAWTHPQDFNPHIYVKGTVPTSSPRTIFTLKVAVPQGINKLQLVLELSPDLIDPNGELRAVKNFDTPTEFKNYTTVLIRTATKNVATVPVVQKPRP